MKKFFLILFFILLSTSAMALQDIMVSKFFVMENDYYYVTEGMIEYPMYLSIVNEMDEEQDIDLSIYFPQTDHYQKHSFDLRAGKRYSNVFTFEVPYSLEPGYYDVVVFIKGDDIRRTVVRELRVY